MIDVQNLSIRFGSHLVINNISFSVDRGSDMIILGHHGAGKTSILNWILKSLFTKWWTNKNALHFDGNG